MAYKNCMKCRVSVNLHRNIFGKGFNSKGLCVGCAMGLTEVFDREMEARKAQRKGEDSILPEIAEAMRVPATTPQIWNGKDVEF